MINVLQTVIAPTEIFVPTMSVHREAVLIPIIPLLAPTGCIATATTLVVEVPARHTQEILAEVLTPTATK